MLPIKLIWYFGMCRIVTKRINGSIAYSKELSKYVRINTYGSCLEVNAKPDPCNKERNCVIKMLSKHKFYLSFEKSRCRW